MIDKVLAYFKQNDVICKKVKDSRPEYGDYIAVFGYGNLTREEIVKEIADNNLSVMFFEGAIHEDEYRKKNVVAN